MLSARLLLTSLFLLTLSACASTTPKAPEEVPPPPEPELISRLPPNIGSLDYQGYRYLDEAADGFTFRYSNARKKRMADIYVYPVAEENAELEHAKLVMGSTRATLRAIGEAARKGIYHNFNVLTAATKARGFRTIARVETTYLRQNLASYSVLYQTEYDGTLMKIRVSMPDNLSNRSSREWDEFATGMFDIIINRLELSASL